MIGIQPDEIKKSVFAMRLSQVHPVFYHLRVQQKRLFRGTANVWQASRFAQTQSLENLPHTCIKHQSLLRRKMGSTDPQLQENKIVNLGIAHKTIDGLIIQPGEIFSFWRRVGNPTAAKGYVEGLQLSKGDVKTGTGGGLCQLGNLLYWMVLHTPLEVIERHHHSFDPFPDERRVLPFGSGASVFYNYIDLRFSNPTEQSFQLRVWLTDEHLKGAVRTGKEWPLSYHIIEKEHRFLRESDKTYRTNEIWREVIDKSAGNKLKEELVIKNFSEVKYSIESLENN
jgi:vancomycin resistance protein VanW